MADRDSFRQHFTRQLNHRHSDLLDFFKHIRERWSNWTGDRDMEIAIRQHLNDNGYFGGGAKLQNVRLVAVQRPGWLQVYRFDVKVRVKPPEPETDGPDADPQCDELFGLVRNDARTNRHTVRVFVDESGRRQLFAQWSDELICLRGSQGLR